MALKSVVYVVALLYKLGAYGGKSVGGGSGEDQLYFPFLIAELSHYQSGIENGFVLKIKETLFKEVAVLTSGPVEKILDLFSEVIDFGDGGFIFILYFSLDAKEHDLFEMSGAHLLPIYML